jgi:16S rRNA processing protein RimM
MPARAQDGPPRDEKPGHEKPGGALICVGVIAAAHGIKGEVKVKSFTESAENFAAYGPLWDEAGARRFEVTVRSRVKDGVIAAIRGVTTRNAAEGLRGTRLFIPRAALPEAGPDEFYYADLIGLRALLADGTELGEVAAVHDFGAGNVIEIKGAKGLVLDLPFTAAVVPVVDVASGHIVVAPPEGLLKAGAAKEKGPSRARGRRGHKG